VNITQARDEINLLFRTAWLADVNSQNLPIMYDDHADSKPKGEGSWVRITIRHTSSRQRTFNRPGQRRFTRLGTVFIQVFSASGHGLSKLDLLTNIVTKSIEGKSTPGGIWFRNVVANEIGHTGPWFQANVSGVFEYDEVL
jgi:hypothetical protein